VIQAKKKLLFLWFNFRGDCLGKVTSSIEIEAFLDKVFVFIISEKMNDVWKEWV
jgi:hypothetical protein